MSIERVIEDIRKLEAERTKYKKQIEEIWKISFDRLEPNKAYKIRQILGGKKRGSGE